MIKYLKQDEDVLDISAVIPFKDNVDATYSCVESLKKFGPNIKEILLVSNNSSKKEFKRIKRLTKDHKNIKLYNYDIPFNFQKINNWAAKQCSSSYLLFTNNDIEFTKKSAGLIEHMLEKSKEPNVGVVGTLLLYKDEATIQHAGVYLEPGGTANHLYKGKRLDSVRQGKNKNFPYKVNESKPLSAVTAAFCIVEKNKFFSVNGFDERFTIGGGDVDLCLRLNDSGMQTWYVSHNYAYVIHKEKETRKNISVPFSDYYWSYLSYIPAFDLEKGDIFLPSIVKKLAKAEKRLQKFTEYDQKNRRIETIYPLLPQLGQKPQLIIVMAHSKGQFSDELHKIIGGIYLAKEKRRDIRLISNIPFTTSEIKKALNENNLKFSHKIKTRIAEIVRSQPVVKLPMHPNDLFYCAQRTDFKLVKKLPIDSRMVLMKKPLIKWPAVR